METAAQEVETVDPVTQFVDEVIGILLATWNVETNRLLGSNPGEALPDGTKEGDPPAGVTAFDSALGRIVTVLTSFRTRIPVGKVAVEVHARTWGENRAKRTRAPIFLCDYTGGGKSHMLFWLVLPD